jgi:hypothetical protein
MDLSAQKDHFSRAVVRAVAAAGGVKCDVPSHDEDSIDLELVAPDAHVRVPGRRLSVQAKCTKNTIEQNGAFSVPLPVKNYNDLRGPAYVPRILVVVHVPPDPADWIAADAEKMILRRCAYWKSLAGEPGTENTSTVNVTVPSDQVFDVDALDICMSLPGAAL